jgi:hypothetical protein
LAAAGQDLEAAADADLATAAEPEAALGTQGALGRGRRWKYLK